MRITRPFDRLLILAVAAALSACANTTYDRDVAIPIPIPGRATVAFAGGSSDGRENEHAGADTAADRRHAGPDFQLGAVRALKIRG
jgi:hypothetical protein